MRLQLKMVIFGTTILGSALTGGTAMSSDPAAEAHVTAARVGHVVGAASECVFIQRPRLQAMTDKLEDAIGKFSTNGTEAAYLIGAYDKGVTDGQNAIKAKQVNCAFAETDLTELERPNTAWLPEHPKPVTVAPGPSSAAGADVKQAPQPLAATEPLATPASLPAPPAARANVPAVHGISDNEIRFGMAAPLSGPAKELGRQMKRGIEVAFKAANDAGGINGRKLTLVAVDDGYEPSRTGDAMKQLNDKEQVFGIIGNVGTPTTAVALPYTLSNKMLFFGAFTGAGLLRRDPPDRYVFNYRASYAEETNAVVRYLVKTRRIRPEQIAVFAQQDGYGDSGFEGVAKAMRALNTSGDSGAILRLNYQRNTVDVDAAIAQLQQYQRQRNVLPIRAVVMVATYRAAAKFIEKTRDPLPGLVYTNVSFVGSTSLATELMVLGAKFATGVIVTQVVPPVGGYSSVVLDYKAAMEKYFQGDTPDYVSFEGYLEANILIEGLRRAGPQFDTERLVGVLEGLKNFDLGLGVPVNFSPADHQALHKVWGTQLDEAGHFQSIDLE